MKRKQECLTLEKQETIRKKVCLEILPAILNEQVNVKICFACKQQKNINLFNKDKSKKDGVTSICKSCFKQIQDKQRPKKSHVYENDSTLEILFKTCPKCKQEKNLKMFSKSKNNQNGFSCYCRSCDSIKHNKLRQFYISNPMILDSSALKTCSTCKKEQNVNMFNQTNTSRDGLYASCKPCVSQRDILYRQTVSGALHKLLQYAIHHAKERGRKGREEAGTFDLIYEDLLIIYNKQQGKAYRFPSKTMSLVSGEKWHITLERLNPARGYNKENVVLCCEEFNGQGQWTNEKVELLKQHHQAIHQEQEIDFNEVTFRKSIIPQIISTICTNIDHIEKQANGGCKSCAKEYRRIRNDLPLVFFQTSITNMRRRSIRRSVKNRKDRSHEFNVTLEDIVNIYIQQKGKCKISHMLMILRHHSDFQMSVERIDNKKGYTKDNIVLVCLEFNTSKQWTRDMYLEWMNSFVIPSDDNSNFPTKLIQ